jgi:hypothetical protein
LELLLTADDQSLGISILAPAEDRNELQELVLLKARFDTCS